MKIYLVKDGEAVGPFTEEEVRRWLSDGRLDPETFATADGLGEWKKISEVLPAEPAPAEVLPPAYPVASPAAVPASAVNPTPAPMPAGDSKDPNEDDKDLRRYAPTREDQFRSFAWLGVGLMFLLAFLWPTRLNDGMGIVNFQLGWAKEHVSGAAIPLMLWPGFVGVLVIALGFLVKNRFRALLVLALSLVPLILVLVVGGTGIAKVAGAMNDVHQEIQNVDFNDPSQAHEQAEKMGGIMQDQAFKGFLGMGAAALLTMVIVLGIVCTIYLTLLITPHAVRHFRPNSSGAYYFALIGGVFLIIFQLVVCFFSLFSFGGGVLAGLGMVTAILAQIAAVIVGFCNTSSQLAKTASRRALWSLGLAVGGVFLWGGTVLVVSLLEGGMQSTIGMYIFKAWLGFVAAALMLPLGVMDLWLGQAAAKPQNN